MGTLQWPEVTRYWAGSGPGRGSVQEKPFTVWSRSAEAPPQVHMMVLDLEVISERVQAGSPQMLTPFAPLRKRLPGDNAKPRPPPRTRASPRASPTVCLT